MKAIAACLLVVMVTAVAGARLPPKLAAFRVQRGHAQRSLLEGHPAFSFLPMPAIHIPEFGKETSFASLADLKTAGTVKMPDFPDMQTIAPPDMHWVNLRPTAPQLNAPGLDSTADPAPASNNDNQKSSFQQQPDSQKADFRQPYSYQQEGQPQQTQQDHQQSGQGDCSKTDKSADAVMRCVNAVRTKPQAFKSDYPCGSPWLSTISHPGRPALRHNSKLASSAQRQADDMARNSRINHVGSDGSTVGERIKDAGYTTFPQAENIAEGQTSAHQVTMEWMCSEGHRRAIMNCEYDEVGTAVASNGGTWYYAQNFGCSSGRCPKCDVA